MGFKRPTKLGDASNLQSSVPAQATASLALQPARRSPVLAEASSSALPIATFSRPVRQTVNGGAMPAALSGIPVLQEIGAILSALEMVPNIGHNGHDLVRAIIEAPERFHSERRWNDVQIAKQGLQIFGSLLKYSFCVPSSVLVAYRGNGP